MSSVTVVALNVRLFSIAVVTSSKVPTIFDRMPNIDVLPVLLPIWTLASISA